jgi:hypothetical protein
VLARRPVGLLAPGVSLAASGSAGAVDARRWPASGFRGPVRLNKPVVVSLGVSAAVSAAFPAVRTGRSFRVGVDERRCRGGQRHDVRHGWGWLLSAALAAS